MSKETDSTAELTEELDSTSAEMLESEAKTEADAARFTLKLRRPVMYESNEITELHYDFDALTGKDSREVMRELNLQGVGVMFQTMSEEFMRGMAARACTDLLPDKRKIGTDIFDKMAVRDVNSVLVRLRRFL